MIYWILKIVLSPVFKVFWRVEVDGLEHVPAYGPAVLAANHQSFCDSFFLPLVVRRRVTYVAKAEYFESWKTAWFFRASGQIPMRRDGGSVSQRALDTATEVLDSGGLLGIYPEGTRAPDFRLHRGHTGVARLSLRCDVPIVPVGLLGTRAVQPPGSNLMRPFRPVTVRFGPPLVYEHAGKVVRTGQCGPPRSASDRAVGAGGATPAGTVGAQSGSAVAGVSVSAGSGVSAGRRERRRHHRVPAPRAAERVIDQAELRSLTDALMKEIARLSDQEYVDHYAGRSR